MSLFNYNSYKEGTVPEAEKKETRTKSKRSKSRRFYADTKRNVRHPQTHA